MSIVCGTYNVHKCRGWDGRVDPQRIGAILKSLSADVLALQEVDRRFGGRKAILKSTHLGASPGVRLVELGEGRTSTGWHGNALLISEKVTVRAIRRLNLPALEPRGCLVAELGTPIGDMTFVACHLGLTRKQRALQVAHLVSLAGGAGPVVIAGDMNEHLAPDHPKSSLTGFKGLPDCCFSDPVPTFPALLPVLPFDRLVASGGARIVRTRRVKRKGVGIASDHLPLLAEVSMLASAKASMVRA